MATLSFKLAFRSMDMNELDLPVEIRKPSAALVTRARSSQRVELPAGTYYVTARLPAGQRITRLVELADASAEVVLEPDPEDQETHEWDEERHFLDRPASVTRASSWSEWAAAPVAAVLPAGDATMNPPNDAAGAGAIALVPEQAYLRVFSGNLVRGDHRLESVHQAVTPQEQGSGRVVYFRIATATPAPVVVQLLEVDVPALNLVVPQFARLALSRRSAPDRLKSRFKLEAFTKNPVANLLLRYGRQGAYQRAADAAQSEQLLSDKLEDPVAAAIGAYGLLRTGECDRLHNWAENLDKAFPWLPDGAAIHGEYLAKLGKHAAALAAFAQLPDRGLPLVADGLFYAVERLKAYAQLRPARSEDVDVALARGVLEHVDRFAPAVHRQRPLTSFPGLDPTRPEFVRLRIGQLVNEALEVSWM